MESLQDLKPLLAKYPVLSLTSLAYRIGLAGPKSNFPFQKQPHPSLPLPQPIPLPKKQQLSPSQMQELPAFCNLPNSRKQKWIQNSSSQLVKKNYTHTAAKRGQKHRKQTSFSNQPKPTALQKEEKKKAKIKSWLNKECQNFERQAKNLQGVGGGGYYALSEALSLFFFSYSTDFILLSCDECFFFANQKKEERNRISRSSQRYIAPICCSKIFIWVKLRCTSSAHHHYGDG